jgi:hypothetical protein
MAFSKISEKQVTRAIISEFAREFEDHIENDPDEQGNVQGPRTGNSR